MLCTVVAGACLPLAFTPTFYYWDDTAAAAVGVWRRIAESVLSGHSPALHLDMWRGGNFAAEAATGMWNPILVILMITIQPVDDLALGITIAKIVLLSIAAFGVQLLARAYGASAWPAAVAGTMIPLSGWALFMDGEAWINGTTILAFAPWAWWAVRRCATTYPRAWDPVLAAFACYLLTSTGNPYGVVVLAVVFAAVAFEAVVNGRARRLPVLIALGFAAVCLTVMVYLPFLLTSSLGNRAESNVHNDEFLAVSLSDLIGMSTPSHRPAIEMWGGFMSFPGVFLAWFVLPLLPWLRWPWLRRHVRSCAGPILFGVVFLLLVLGPSQLWMFRWPARLLPFLCLAVAILFAVLLSRGMHRSHPVRRAMISVGIVLLGAWIAVSDDPTTVLWHSISTLLVLGALGIAVVLRQRLRTLCVFFIVSALPFLGVQLILTPSNGNVADYGLPTSLSVIGDRPFGTDDAGLVVQVFDAQREIAEQIDATRWRTILPGNLPSAARMESTTAYSGIGFTALDDALCATYNGGSCYDLWARLWLPVDDAPAKGRPLADLLGADTVVVSRLSPRPAPPPGWRLEESAADAWVFTRDDQPDDARVGTVTSVSSGVRVDESARSGPVDERLRISTASAGSIAFARVAWPGYEVTIDGTPIEPQIGAAGLLTIAVPAGLDSAVVDIRFTPPGTVASRIACALGAVTHLILTLAFLRRSFRRRS